MAPGAGPRHVVFHHGGRILYVINELNATITALEYDPASGNLGRQLQTVSTEPAGYTGPHSTAEIAIHPSGKFLYASNRGHNSIACFAVDASSGRLTALGHVATEAVPSAFSLDPEGHFLFAAGSASNRLAAYRVNSDTGELMPLGTYDVGKRPMWVLITRLGG
jgi:6-phosphogluconolactonase